MAIVTPGRYSGTSFAGLDGKSRVAVPSNLRGNIPLANVDGRDERVLWVGYHDRLPCLVAFGQDQYDRLTAEIEVERTSARELKQVFDEEAEFKKRFSWTDPYALDGSGRFIPNAMHRRRSGTKGLVTFVGAGKRFEIWSAATLADCELADPELRAVAREMLAAAEGKP